MEGKREAFDLFLFVTIINRQSQIQEKMSKCQKVWLISLNQSPYCQKFQWMWGIESEVFVHCLQILWWKPTSSTTVSNCWIKPITLSVYRCLEVLRLVPIDADWCLSLCVISKTTENVLLAKKVDLIPQQSC